MEKIEIGSTWAPIFQKSDQPEVEYP